MILCLGDMNVFRRKKLKAVPIGDPIQLDLLPQEQCWLPDAISKIYIETNVGPFER